MQLARFKSYSPGYGVINESFCVVSNSTEVKRGIFVYFTWFITGLIIPISWFSSNMRLILRCIAHYLGENVVGVMETDYYETLLFITFIVLFRRQLTTSYSRFICLLFISHRSSVPFWGSGRSNKISVPFPAGGEGTPRRKSERDYKFRTWSRDIVLNSSAELARFYRRRNVIKSRETWREKKRNERRLFPRLFLTGAGIVRARKWRKPNVFFFLL